MRARTGGCTSAFSFARRSGLPKTSAPRRRRSMVPSAFRISRPNSSTMPWYASPPGSCTWCPISSALDHQASEAFQRATHKTLAAGQTAGQAYAEHDSENATMPVPPAPPYSTSASRWSAAPRLPAPAYKPPPRACTSIGCTSPTSTLPLRANSSDRAQALRLRAIRHPVLPHVDHRRARRNKFAGHQRRPCRSPRPGYPPAGTLPPDSTCASGKSSRSRFRAAASAPSACPRYRCARSSPPVVPSIGTR